MSGIKQPISRRQMLKLLGAGAGASLFYLTGCTSKGTPTPLASTPVVSATPTSPAKPAKLVVWDVWTRDQETAVVNAVHELFKARHPEVEIDRVPKSFDDIKATSKLALSSPDGPDIVQINQGWSDMGAMVEGGLLVDLTPYVSKYGWDKKISASLRARNSFSSDGKHFGVGNLYGVPPTAELVGVYYRKDIFQKLGVSVPKTFGEFEEILKVAKEGGYTPIVFGNLEGWPALHVYSEILFTQVTDRAYIDDLVYAWGKGASWETPQNIYAARKMQEWTNNGYFTAGFEGIGYDDSTAMFDTGNGVMMITGSWMSSTFSAGEYGEQIGFFLVPPEKAGGFKMSVGGTSLCYAIRASSPNRELAAEYLAMMMSDEAANEWAKVDTVPVTSVDKKILKAGSLFADLIESWNWMNEHDAVGHYIDWATPTFYDTSTAAIQELLANKIKPEEFVKKLEADRQAFMAERK